VRAWIATVAGVVALTPVGFWFVEHHERKKAQDEARTLREEERDRLRRSQIRDVSLTANTQKDLAPGWTQWTVRNDSSGPIHHVTFSGTTYPPPPWAPRHHGAGLGPLAPNTSTVMVWDVVNRGKLEDVCLFVIDADSQLWRVAEYGQIEPVERPST